MHELEGHQALVTWVVVVPNTSKLWNYCWTSSLDGTIRYWDFSAPELVKTVDIKLPIFSMVIPSLTSRQDEKGNQPTDLLAYVYIENISLNGDKPKPLHGQIRKCNLTTELAKLILKEDFQVMPLSMDSSQYLIPIDFTGSHLTI